MLHRQLRRLQTADFVYPSSLMDAEEWMLTVVRKFPQLASGSSRGAELRPRRGWWDVPETIALGGKFKRATNCSVCTSVEDCVRQLYLAELNRRYGTVAISSL